MHNTYICTLERRKTSKYKYIRDKKTNIISTKKNHLIQSTGDFQNESIQKCLFWHFRRFWSNHSYIRNINISRLQWFIPCYNEIGMIKSTLHISPFKLKICPSFQQMKVTYGTFSFDMWRETPIPMYMSVYYFNCTNAEEIMDDSYNIINATHSTRPKPL